MAWGLSGSGADACGFDLRVRTCAGLRSTNEGLVCPTQRAVGAVRAAVLTRAPIRSDVTEHSPDQPSCNRPAGAGEEADAEPDADQSRIDIGWHCGPLPLHENANPDPMLAADVQPAHDIRYQLFDVLLAAIGEGDARA